MMILLTHLKIHESKAIQYVKLSIIIFFDMSKFIIILDQHFYILNHHGSALTFILNNNDLI